jgi:adenylate cyclase
MLALNQPPDLLLGDSMTTQEVKRKLAAILSADVKGYSRLMGEDEKGTVHTLNAYKEVMAGLIQNHHGRVVDAPGDNVLAEFASVVDAVECAVEIQKELKTRNAELPENRRMEFRIGVNLGDVIEDGEQILGDGVNIAARLEGLSEAGGVCISGTAYDQVENKLDLRYDYLGEQSVKNIARPVRVYRVLAGSGGSFPKVSGRLDFLKGPSIAVLPFVNMSGEPEQEYFSDGITEEIITGLSKVPRLMVVARNSSFTYKGKSVKVQQVGQELGVRYLLKGSVRKAGDRVRITAQLVDTTTGHHLWAERYDRDLRDIFALQDEITVNVMRAMQVELTEGEQACEWLKHGSSNIEAYEKGMKGMACFRLFSPEGNIRARQTFEECVAIEPKSSGAHVMLGWTHLTDVMNGWSESPEESINRALGYAQKALSLDDSQPDTYALLGNIYLFQRQFDRAIKEGERAIALNPNGADHHVWLAMILTSAGRPEEAVELLNKAIRLNPFPPNWYFLSLGNAFFTMGRYEEAVGAYKRTFERSPDFLLTKIGLAASYGALGGEEDARAAAIEVLRIDPKFSLQRFAKGLLYEDQKDADRYINALRKAGLK